MNRNLHKDIIQYYLDNVNKNIFCNNRNDKVVILLNVHSNSHHHQDNYQDYLHIDIIVLNNCHHNVYDLYNYDNSYIVYDCDILVENKEVTWIIQDLDAMLWYVYLN